MSMRFGRVQKASALVPLALLSAAWTASLTGLGSGSAVATGSTDGALPDGTSMPSQAVEAPASMTAPGLAAGDGSTVRGAGAGDASGIPAAALSAYQRAETIINKADPTCHLSWQLVAAIGKVESNHGRYGGNTLDADGVAQPGIYGLPLNGQKGTRAIADTDAGQYDNDSEWDRAVGPMQFIPSTWSVVGVDADADGKRNPQDIHDAALATAVYLCSGDDDLAAEKGQRAAVFRYNNSTAYVDLVLSIMRAYLAGDFTSVPNSTTPSSDDPIQADPAPGGRDRDRDGSRSDGGASASAAAPTTPSTSDPGSSGDSGQGADGGDAGDPGQGGGGNAGGGGGDRGGSNDGGGRDPKPSPSPDPTQAPNDTPLDPVTDPLKDAVASTTQLVGVCTEALLGRYGDAPGEAVQRCVGQLTGKTLPEARAAVGGVVAGLAGLVGNLLNCVVGGIFGNRCD